MIPGRWSDSLQTLDDMIANCRMAIKLRGAQAIEDDDEIRRLALLHLIQLVGKAARRVPGPVRELAPDVPWTRIVGVRNYIVHAYDRLDMAILDDVLHARFPQLLPELERLREEVERRGSSPLPPGRV